LIADVVRERGPLTVAAFMDLALYDPRFGYYARAARRSGRTGDFFTSVDVGPLFGELLAVQIAEMADILTPPPSSDAPVPPFFELFEAGAGDGRLAADMLEAVRRRQPELYSRLRLHLVEASSEARAAQPDTLGELRKRLASSSDRLPESFTGVLVANELLDALPTHAVVMRERGLRELYVGLDERGALAAREGPPSTPALAEYLARVGVALEPGWRAEISLRAVEWAGDTARRLTRGFIILIDYGHDARELYSVRHSSGTLTTYSRHRTEPAAPQGAPAWLSNPGHQDITAHVDFTSIRQAAEAAGCTTLGFLDQTYFVLGLAASLPLDEMRGLKHRLALKTLLLPGGLGSTMKVLILGKNVGTPVLRGSSYKGRVT
jgi:SAM-dependent MidA family methyltransferase